MAIAKSGERFEYSGDPALGERIGRALHNVVDPEMALDIVELGLVYGVSAGDGAVKVRLTMTSAACPVTEMIVDDVHEELARELGEEARVEVEVVWDPPWSPERMSPGARSAMGWD